MISRSSNKDVSAHQHARTRVPKKKAGQDTGKRNRLVKIDPSQSRADIHNSCAFRLAVIFVSTYGLNHQ